ncbi:MAG: ATP-binding protein [Ottowia sp.]|nr:ATP-binding protein [Ottowia sp.]
MNAVPHRTPFPLGPIARTTVSSRLASLRPVQLWVMEFARCFGLPEDDIRRIELVVEEAFTSVAQSAFEPGETGDIRFVLEHRPGQLVIAVEDRGMPTDLAHLQANEALSLNLLLLRRLLDGFSFINRGTEGKRLELVKNLPAQSIAVQMQEQATVADTAALAPPTEEPRLRLLRPDETLAVAQLAYRSYGYTYVSDFYYPERIRERMESGLLEICGAVTDSGEVLGALCLFYEQADARVAESAAAMVQPRCRGMNLFKDMKQFLFAHGRAKGLYGIYSEAVTIHPYTQQGNITLGAHETGLLLSYVSENVAFKKIGDEMMGQRQALVFYYYRLNPEPLRTVYAPAVHAALVESIHARNGLRRQLEVVPQDHPGEGETRLSVHVRRDVFNDASITLQHAGHDAAALVMHHTRELCQKKVDVIYLNLVMCDPAAAALAGQLADKGYLFGSIIPEFAKGDLLKLQYLNNVAVDPEKIATASPFTAQLLQTLHQQYTAQG